MSDLPARPLAWTEVVSTDSAGDVVQTVAAPPVVDQDSVRPTVDDVAVLESTRTIDEGGNEIGTFTDSTRPTAADVESLIDIALADVLAQLPRNIDPVWYAAISRAVALRAAYSVEISFYREAALTGQGPAMEWGSRFAGDLAALQGLIPKATYVA